MKASQNRKACISEERSCLETFLAEAQTSTLFSPTSTLLTQAKVRSKTNRIFSTLYLFHRATVEHPVYLFCYTKLLRCGG